MDAILKKLNYKEQTDAVVIINSPDTVHPILASFENELTVLHQLPTDQVAFAIVFCTTRDEIDKWSTIIDNKLIDDGLFWIAYPKKSSKRFTCDFNRDTGWQPLGNLGYEPVRQVAFDEDWSALRFRKAKYIKTIKRNPKMLLSADGLKRSNQND